MLRNINWRWNYIIINHTFFASRFPPFPTDILYIIVQIILQLSWLSYIFLDLFTAFFISLRKYTLTKVSNLPTNFSFFFSSLSLRAENLASISSLKIKKGRNKKRNNDFINFYSPHDFQSFLSVKWVHRKPLKMFC